jgi:hypothetical protein
MSKGKKKAIKLLQAQELNAKIDRIVAIRPMANEYSQLVKEVKGELLARKLVVYRTPDGNTAKVKQKPAFMWMVESLKKVLSADVFDALCPRKPDAKKLNQRTAATPEDERLAACRLECGVGKPELEVLAAGESVSTQIAEESDEEAA